jgi:hypothetical protein
MKRADNNISSRHSLYQLKITLKNVKPTIWRRFQVPGNITLYRLHKVIQVLMGWYGYHLFEFKIKDVLYGTPNIEDGYLVENAKRFKVNNILEEGKNYLYTYDLGDNWESILTVEKVIPTETEPRHAVCLKGKRSGPAEDSGGPWGYLEYLELIKTPPDENDDEEIKARREWIGDDYDPEYFNLEEINEDLKRIR